MTDICSYLLAVIDCGAYCCYHHDLQKAMVVVIVTKHSKDIQLYSHEDKLLGQETETMLITF